MTDAVAQSALEDAFRRTRPWTGEWLRQALEGWALLYSPKLDLGDVPEQFARLEPTTLDDATAAFVAWAMLRNVATGRDVWDGSSGVAIRIGTDSRSVRRWIAAGVDPLERLAEQHDRARRDAEFANDGASPQTARKRRWRDDDRRRRQRAPRAPQTGIGGSTE